MELVSSDSQSDSELNEKNGRKNMKKGTKKKKAKGDEFVEDLADSSTPRGKSPLHSVKWERIILDEVFPFLLPFLAKELGFRNTIYAAIKSTCIAILLGYFRLGFVPVPDTYRIPTRA